MPGPRRRVAVLAGVAAFALAADIVSKVLVVAHLQPDQPVHVLGNVFELWLTRNPEAAFNIGFGMTAIFTLIAFVVVVYIIHQGPVVSVAAGSSAAALQGLDSRQWRAPVNSNFGFAARVKPSGR